MLIEKEFPDPSSEVAHFPDEASREQPRRSLSLQ
jgi:hypothetical protein